MEGGLLFLGGVGFYYFVYGVVFYFERVVLVACCSCGVYGRVRFLGL